MFVFMFYTLPIVPTALNRSLHVVWWKTLCTFGQRIAMNLELKFLNFCNLLLSDNMGSLTTTTATYHASHALTWYSCAVLKQGPWTGRLHGTEWDEDKSKLASQICRANFPHQIKLLIACQLVPFNLYPGEGLFTGYCKLVF